MSGAIRPAPRRGGSRPRNPFDLKALPSAIGPALAVIGLLIVGSVSLGLINGQLPSLPGGANPSGGPIRTPTPSNVVVIDPRSNVPGSIAYVKDGNVWVQSGEQAHQLTTGGQDAMPTWSSDGTWIYFVRERETPGRFPMNGQVKDYDLAIPTLERIHPDGSGLVAILEGRYTSGRYLWSFFIRQPSISPDGTTAVVVSDGPNPTKSDMTLKFLNLATGALTFPKIAELSALGHQDPVYSPDGKSVLFAKNAREGSHGASTINRYTIATKVTKTLTGPGYLEPSWSPDGRFIAATKTGATGTDIVILDAGSGAELLRLTNDNASFAPFWSPAGDSIAFMRVDRGVIDLWLIKLTGAGPAWTVGDTLALTISAGLDGASRESWFIPADQLPTPAPTPVPTAAPSGPAASPRHT
jgi:Tol biopolymer transport system component